MTDLETFVQRMGRSARVVRDDDLAYGRQPVFMTVQDAWLAFSQAVIRTPTEDLRALFVDGWLSVDAEEV